MGLRDTREEIDNQIKKLTNYNNMLFALYSKLSKEDSIGNAIILSKIQKARDIIYWPLERAEELSMNLLAYTAIEQEISVIDKSFLESENIIEVIKNINEKWDKTYSLINSDKHSFSDDFTQPSTDKIKEYIDSLNKEEGEVNE